MPIVQAVGTASTGKPKLAKLIEAAMTKAIEDALAEGIPMSDSDTIRERMLAARARVKAEL